MPAAFGLSSAAMHAARIVGPSVAGVLNSVWSVQAILAFQLVIVFLACVATVRLSPYVGMSSSPTHKQGRILEGFSYVRSNRLVLNLTLLATIPTIFACPYLQLLPVIARDVLAIGPDELGALMAMSGVGAIAGGLVTNRAACIGPLGLLILVATIANGGIVLAIAFSTTVWLTAAAIMAGSLTGSMFQSPNNTHFQLQLDEAIRGRVTSV